MDIKQFRGITPRIPELYLGVNSATVAHDINLKHGTLKPWMEPKKLDNVGANSLTIAEYGCCFLSWENCVSVAKWKSTCPRIYVTGRVDYPEVGVLNTDTCEVEYARLGLPMPDITPVVSYITTPDKSIETSARNYIYTYVNWLGEESAPSYASSMIVVNDGQAVTVSGWVAPPSEYRVERVRVYRLVTGFRTGAEKEQEPTSNYLFVDEIPIEQKHLVDTTKDEGLGYAISTREVREPPADLQGIVAVDNTNVLAGFAGNKVYFSQNHQPWNWSLELEITLDDNIVHMVQEDGELYVSTTGRPYTIDGTPDCGDRQCRPVVRSDYPFPDIACGYPHSAIATPFGMVYASTDGLVLLSKTKPPTIITDGVMAVDDWRKCRPETTRLAYYAGYVFCVTDAVSFIMLLDGGTYSADSDYAFMSTISDTPVDMVLSDSGELLMLMDNGDLMQWNSGNKLRPYKWVSAPIQYGSRGWFTSARIRLQGSVNFTVVSERGNSFERMVTEDKKFRLPRFGASRDYKVIVEGTGEVFSVLLGPSTVEQA